MLTKKQRELLVFIDQHMTDHDGIAPSFDEMRAALDLKSKSGIQRLITALVERGYIERLRHRARALRIIKGPDGVAREAPAITARAPVGLPDSMTPSEIAYRLGHRMRQRGADDDDAFKAIMMHISDGINARKYAGSS